MSKLDINTTIAARGYDTPDSVVVMKGFAPDSLAALPNKLSSLPVGAGIDEIAQQSSSDYAKWMVALQGGHWCWLTFEEFLQVNAAGWSVPLFGDKRVLVLENNLYPRLQPLYTPFDHVDEAYQSLSQNDAEDLPDELASLADVFYRFYEQIDRLDGTYYVRCAEVPKDSRLKIQTQPLWTAAELDVVPVSILEEPAEASVFNLESSESDFQHFMTQLVQAPVHDLKVAFTTKLEDSSQSEERLKQLRVLVKLGFASRITGYRQIPVLRPVQNEAAYLAILKENWHYDGFRPLKMYKDPDSGANTTIEVSQARIIEDIVDQAEVALKGKVPRDVFITASTGAGKSVMFQIPALYLLAKHPAERPLTIIISPLIGLMTDQVDSMMAHGIQNARTINSALAPSEKEEIVQQIKNNEIDLLYLSPETLQNQADITQIIGDRHIGMVIVDEAHTVVTWGKSFRADYWYLGLYLQKLRKAQHFPIVTFTATATVGGTSDMFRDIRDSLNMIDPIRYIGYVKRDDIDMQITQLNPLKGRDSLEVKATILEKRMRIWLRNGEKTLIYFPTVKLLNAVKRAISETPKLGDQSRAYYGNMTAPDKLNSLNDFKDGKALFMFATKAFGMGIDIPDIKNVYHYAPTGDVVDYVQEIGRVARKHELVPRGNAVFDFLKPDDFKYVKQLHGMSTIKTWQLKDAMKKILELYKQNRGSRNLVISAEDFKYVLDLDDDKDNQADNKLKIILLMLEKDFASNGTYNYAPFVARPKSVFGKELVLVRREEAAHLLQSKLGPYLDMVREAQEGFPTVYSLRMADFWRHVDRKNSYPNFKRQIFDQKERAQKPMLKVFDRLDFATQIDVTWSDYDGLNAAKAASSRVQTVLRDILSEYAYSGSQLRADVLASALKQRVSEVKSETEALTVVASFINLCDVYEKHTKNAIISRRIKASADQIRVTRTFSNLFDKIRELNAQLFEEQPNRRLTLKDKELTLFYKRTFGSNKSERYELMLAYVGFLESLGLITFSTRSGGDAQIYVRINNTYRMEQAIKNPKYKNDILSKITRDYWQNVAMLEYLFTHKGQGNDKAEVAADYTEFFWNRVEDFFLGHIPEEVKRAEETLAKAKPGKQ
ncbi:DEAD/DEAH box helicase [Lacticaseibacillus kribbianus]|uniref:DEAD/DEAH box helicase n=1 Tax=Lacticaseibacillus kribbianus TaxID=2926292 RepID=UPI001CD49843|nr:DEAD/DEAH box helicase [Lacticaseibacillus kribbianus]